MSLLVIDAGHCWSVYNFVQVLGLATRERAAVVKLDRDLGAAEVLARAPSGVVIMGGGPPGPDLDRAVALVRSLDPKLPLLGVGSGHDALALAEGAKLSTATSSAGRPVDVSHEGAPLFDRVPTPFSAVRYGASLLLASDVKPPLRVIATGPDGAALGIAHETLPRLGVQFALDSIATSAGRRIISNFVRLCTGAEACYAPSGEFLIGFDGVLERLLAGADLAREEAHSIGVRMVNGDLSAHQIGALTAALRAKGERPYEVAGLALALREAMLAVPGKRRRPLVDICGAGGEVRRTFNISTAAALVAAGAGAAVGKQGSRDLSSRPGSGDVVAALGLANDLGPAEAAASLDEAGFAFLSTEVFHSKLKRVIPARARELGPRNIFSFVWPLVNPAGARRHVVGTSTPQAHSLLIAALKAAGSERAMVTASTDGSDELTTIAPCTISELFEDGRIVERVFDPAELGLARARPDDLSGGDAAQNAKLIVGVLRGDKGARRDSVALNAAACLVVVGLASDLKDGLARAFASIDSGAALRALEGARAARRTALVTTST